MSESIHGHEVMKLMLESLEPYTREDLIRVIAERFGKDACFHTCSAENMTADELIDFLETRGKFLPDSDGYQTSADKICDH